VITITKQARDSVLRVVQSLPPVKTMIPEQIEFWIGQLEEARSLLDAQDQEDSRYLSPLNTAIRSLRSELSKRA
jgi:hypothetical protein